MQEKTASFFVEGDAKWLEELIPIVYAELHRQAHNFLRREHNNQTLQTTELINEAYLRLRGQKNLHFESRSHFFAVASNLMRQILVDRARKKHRLKRGGLINDVPLEDAMHLSTETVEIDLVGLDDALKRLENMDPQQARIVELKYFGGLSIQETAEIVGISPATVKRDWNIARAWLLNELSL
ncbi:MAG: sigma-70 family RNA polymerase sigma factor [Pyrinomonadaceae bacterium]